ncbi:MAG: type II toxin-antitoxin system VapC family toxin [Pseudomonadota bacterium]
MKLLLDTHIVLWAAGQPEKLSESARSLLTASDNVLFFSAASIWELPMLHKDPFDRLLLAQARTEGMLLLTVDASISQYQESVLVV